MPRLATRKDWHRRVDRSAATCRWRLLTGLRWLFELWSFNCFCLEPLRATSDENRHISQPEQDSQEAVQVGTEPWRIYSGLGEDTLSQPFGTFVKKRLGKQLALHHLDEKDRQGIEISPIVDKNARPPQGLQTIQLRHSKVALVWPLDLRLVVLLTVCLLVSLCTWPPVPGPCSHQPAMAVFPSLPRLSLWSSRGSWPSWSSWIAA